MNPAASVQPQPEDAQPEDVVPAVGGALADGEPARVGESGGPATPEEEADDEYEPLWQGFGRTT